MRPPLTPGPGVQLPSAEALLAEAREAAGIDLPDEAAREPLARLVASLNSEGRLHEEGASGMRSRLVRILANRLRMQRDFAAHPEIADQVVDRPVFICGMARTGSTKTQKLLAASGDFNWLPYWQVINPALLTGDRNESPQPRIDDTDALAAWFDAASPGTRAGHAFETHEPEEESFILEHSLRTPTFLGWAPIDSYLEWLMTQDMSAQFIQLRDTLKYLQWQGLADPGKRWVLKSPLYSGLEPLLLQTFPDAKLVMTHRNPVKTMASGLKLLGLFYEPYSAATPDAAYYVAGQVAAAEAHLAARAALPPGTFHDVDFDQLCTDVRGVAKGIYAFADIEPGSASFDNIVVWDEANPPYARGKFSYSLVDYGLTEERLTRDFTSYIAFIGTIDLA